MSNYAPDPSFEKVYDNLQNKTLADVTAEDIQKLTDPTFIQATNQDALLTYNTINQAAMRNGSPIPKTQKIVEFTCDDSGSSNAVVFTPSKGEVWSITSGSFASSGGTSRLFLFLKDNVNTLSMEIADESASSGQQNPLDPFNTPFILDENMSILATVSVTDSTSSAVRLSCIRIR